MRVAVVGAGISGLGAAYALCRQHDVTLYEAADRPGGHTHTVDVALDGIKYPADTGFLVYAATNDQVLLAKSQLQKISPYVR